MNHSTLLQSSFQLDGPINTDSDFPGAQRHFSGSTVFSMDDEDSNRRSGAIGNHLAQPVSIPATNGLRYNTQQSAMQDVPYATSPILMSPSDSCSETFSPASGSLYSHSPGLPYDRMSDFRSHRVPPLQPPTGVSPTGQSHGNTSLLGRNDNYPGAYAIHRSAFPSLSSLSDLSRVSPYTSTPRGLDCTIDRSQNVMFSPSGSMFMDPGQRLPQPISDAPPFHDTNILHHIISGNQMIKPEIQAKMHKGFFQVDEKWTCYRRNYFAVSCSFSFHPWSCGPFYLKYSEQASEQVRQFAMSISAIVNAQYGEVRELVQHTPKRDKQSERKPGKIIMQPCQPSAVILSHGSATNSGQPGFSLMSQSGGMPVDYNSSYNGAPQSSLPPSQHTFERIQFQKATANNGKRRAQQQYYNLVVELFAEISPVGSSESQWIKIARRLSHPMVVRGRSPGHYKDGRRDSSTSMGPDGGNGGSGDGSGGAVLPPGLGQTTRSHLGLMPYDSSQRGGPSYGRNDYHHMGAADHSPLSESPHISSSASSNFDIGILNDSMNPIDSLKNTSSMDSYQDPSFGLVDSKKEGPYQHHLPPFEYDPISKDSEDSGTSFPGAYNSMVSMLPHEHGESSHFLKQPTRMASQGYHPGPGGYDSIYSTSSRSASSSYYRIPNSQGLCA